MKPLFFLTAVFAGGLAHALEVVNGGSGTAGISYEGRVFDTAGSPSTQTLSFNLKVFDSAGTCILRDENVGPLDLGQTGGAFSVTVGNGAPAGGDAGLSLADVFRNDIGVQGRNSSGAPCMTAPSPGSGRRLRVTILDGASATVLSPDVSIGTAPYAVVAETLQGKRATDFIRVNPSGASALNQANLENLFVPMFYSELNNLVTGNSTHYVHAGTGQGASVPVLSNPSSVPGTMWVEQGTNDLKYFDGGTVRSLTTPSGGGGTPSGPAGGDLGGGYPNPTVARLSGTPVSGTPASGQVLRFNGTSYSPATLRLGDVRGNGGGAAFPGACSAAEALTWNVVTDSLSCQTITIPAGQVSGLPSSPWLTNSPHAYFMGGNVGIGIASPSNGLHLHSPGGEAWFQISSGATGTGASNGFQLGIVDASTAEAWTGSGMSLRVKPGNNISTIFLPNGKVGVGTTSPMGVLTAKGSAGEPAVSGGTDPNLIFRVQNTNNAIDFGVSDTWASGWIQTHMAAINGTGARLNINPLGGAVQIGSYSAPSDQNQLTVFQNGTSNAILVKGSSGSLLTFQTSGGTDLGAFSSTGNFGVGTSSPQSKIDVVGGQLQVRNLNPVAADTARIALTNHSGSGTYPGITFRNDNSPGIGGRNKAGIFAVGNGSFGIGDLHFVVNGNSDNGDAVPFTDTKMTIAANGNVGVGTTTPAARVQVHGGSSAFSNDGQDTVLNVISASSGGTTQPMIYLGNNRGTVVSRRFKWATPSRRSASVAAACRRSPS